MHGGRAGVLLGLLVTACAASPTEVVEASPVSASAQAETEAVYLSILESAEFGRFCQEWLSEARPHVDEDLIADVAATGIRWDIDHFPSWQQLQRLPIPAPGDPSLRLPHAVLASYSGSGHAGVRFSRVGFDPERRQATVIFKAGRLGVFIVGGHLDLDRLADDTWSLAPIEAAWVLAD